MHTIATNGRFATRAVMSGTQSAFGIARGTPGGITMIGQVVRTLKTIAPWSDHRPRRATRRQAIPREELQARADRVRFHLGRGRRARDAGRYEEGAREARRALLENAGNPWAHALLGQCLMRQASPDLDGARLALERACALDPTNGYFVRLLLDVLEAQGDSAHRANVLDWAWWAGAPVERWLGPDGPRRRAEAAPPAGARPAPVAPVRQPAPARERMAAGVGA
jgi:hypothetical protein